MENYFAAANTGRGFVSWFSDIFDPCTIDFTYIIKGGSGTGKSTLMKKVAAKAEKLGGICQRYYCSSDPTSLDGIIIKMPNGRSIAMLDGTAPHTHDPKYPGAADTIVNLGEYWCEDILKGQKADIMALSQKKASLFSEAYSYFSAASVIVRAQLDEIKGVVLQDKLNAACERLLTQRMRECKVRCKEGKTTVKCLSALSTHGETHFDSFSDMDRVCLVTDVFSARVFLFEALLAAAQKLGLKAERAPMPLMPDYTEALRLPELSMSIVSKTDKTDVKSINMARFIDRDSLQGTVRTRCRILRRTSCELVEAGLLKLSEIRGVHEELEKIYIGAMDFTRLGTATEQLLERIFA